MARIVTATFVLALALLVVLRFGLPADATTWIAFATIVFGGMNSIFVRKRTVVYVTSLLILLALAFPDIVSDIPLFANVNNHYVRDDNGGRKGVVICSHLRFVTQGANTSYLESLLGPLAPRWRYCAPMGSRIRDGNDRVHARSVIFESYLDSALSKLPADADRTAVARCLVAENNRLRVHQGLMITVFWAKAQENNPAAHRWWAQNSGFFVQISDNKKAAEFLWCWRNKIGSEIYDLGELNSLNQEVRESLVRHIRAAKYQEEGRWGGDSEFGDAYQALERAPRER